jgi:hypothetical protein
MFARAGVGATVALMICLGTGVAAADEPGASAGQPEGIPSKLFWDRDAVMFVYAPLLGTFAIDTLVTPRTSPLAFSSTEGGAESRKANEVPGVALSIGGALVAGGIALGDDPARFQHAKGLAESLATSGFIAVSAKRLFGRHRPDYDPSNPTSDSLRSFPSGHTTRAVTTITYAALYLRYHGFDQWREPGTLPWWETATYVGLGSLAVGLAGERVYHHRHHLTDVVAGGILGAASSTLFFYYNERKFQRGAREAAAATVDDVEPMGDDALAERPALPAFDGPMLNFSGSF